MSPSPNPHSKTVCCESCGRDTRRMDAFCLRCIGKIPKGPPRKAELETPYVVLAEEDDEYVAKRIEDDVDGW